MRRSVAILLAAVVVVAMSIGVWRYTRPLDRPERLTLSTVDGDVALTGPDRDGRATPGLAIRPDDHVTTRDGRAVLELEGGTRVRIGPSSSVLITGVDATGVELELEGGAVKAVVRPESGAVAVSGAGITAQATDADLEMAITGELAVIQSLRGDVALMGADVSRLGPGERAVIRERIAKVAAIPEDLLLTVAWPEARRTREAMGDVSGRTSAGATVTIMGAFGERVVQADATGFFVARVPLGEGENPVTVRAVDVFGDESRVRGVLQTRDTSPPTLRGGVEYGN